MTFEQKINEENVNIWELQISQSVPCSDEEKEIYGVDYKLDLGIKKPYIAERLFVDGGTFYSVHSGSGLAIDASHCFQELIAAQEFLVEQFQ